MPSEFEEWSGLNLDYVALPGADLRGKNFARSSLRFANLDNVDLRGAILREADLTGVRIERTSEVDALAVDTERGRVYGAYSDGIVREWRLKETGAWSSETVYTGLGDGVRELELVTPSIACALLGDECYVFSRTEPQWTPISRMPASPFVRSLGAISGSAVWTTLGCEGGRLYKLDLMSGTLAEGPSLHHIDTDATFPIREWMRGSEDRLLIRKSWMLSGRMGGYNPWLELWNLETGQRWSVNLIEEPTSFDVAEADLLDGYVIAVGTESGQLFQGLTNDNDGSVHLRPIASDRGHDGTITAVRFLSEATVVTGGMDRCIRVWEYEAPTDPALRRVATLHLTLRCRGVNLQGVRGEEERRLLAALAESDEE